MFEKIITFGRYRYKIVYTRSQTNDIVRAYILSHEHDFFESVSFNMSFPVTPERIKESVQDMAELCKKHAEKIKLEEDLEKVLLEEGFTFNVREEKEVLPVKIVE